MSGMPSITITFTELASSAIQRGEKGIIAMILKETTVPTNPVISVASVTDIPNTLSTANQNQLKLALKGYVNAPLRVVAYIIPKTVLVDKYTVATDTTGKNPHDEGWYEKNASDEYVLTSDTVVDDEKTYYIKGSESVNNTDYTDALAYFRTVKFDYLVVPTAGTDAKTSDLVSYVQTERANDKLIKAVLPNTVADKEFIVNYATEKVYEGDTEYTTEEFCARIAGIIAGTPIAISCTYAPVPELTDCTRLSKSDMDSAVDAGKLIVWWDGEKVKVARGVNSLTTLTQGKNTQFQKIKIVDTMDMIANDIRMTAQDNYLGKYANTYDNKCLLISAIGNYFDGLIADNVLQSAKIEIDIDANRSYLKARGVDVDSMTDDEIKVANTGSYVFLKATLSILDAIEDIVLPITI